MNDELNIISDLASPSLPEVYVAADFANIKNLYPAALDLSQDGGVAL